MNPDLPKERVPAKKPPWFKISLQQGDRYKMIDGLVDKHSLATVCQEARCPNIYECWNEGTATFMLMGDTCTRACRFCHVKNGNPKGILDTDEPKKVAESVRLMGLDYVVLTSVNRDDLEDGGAKHFADTVRAIKEVDSNILVEALTPDFKGRQEDIQTMLDSGLEVLAHNVETVRRLVPWVRDGRTRHDISLNFHRVAKELKPEIVTKSSIMLGLGERIEEVVECMQELRDHNVDVVTLGQYLRPTPQHHPVVRYVPPEEFKELEIRGQEMGFKYIASGPMVRSSYRAGEFYIRGMLKNKSKETEDVRIQSA